ncbi:putative sulfate exporter family transporter [Francisella tularensis]|nr:putative sulfate exporter family transporter [Francisella tularensis]
MITVVLSSLALSVIILVAKVILGIFLETVIFGLDVDTSILVTAGIFICGAAVVLAAVGTLKS